MSNSVFGDHYGGLINGGFSATAQPENMVEGSLLQDGGGGGGAVVVMGKDSSNIIDESIRFSFNGFPLNMGSENAWKLSSLVWESSPCPSEISSTSYSTSKCYT